MPKNRPGKFHSLKLELLVMGTILTVVMNGGLALLITWIYDQSLAEFKVDAARTSAKGIALALALTPEWSGFPLATLERVGTPEDLTLVLVVNQRGQMLPGLTDKSTPRDWSMVRATLAGGQVEASFDGRRVSVSAPVLRHNVVVGAVCLAGSVDHLATARSTTRMWVLSALAANIILMSFFVFSYLNDRLVIPLRELANDLTALGEDRFVPRSRPRISREMEKLFTTFEQTAQELMGSRHRLLEQLKTIHETRAQLVASEKMATVGQVASGLAHELGNPIGALTGFVYLLGQDGLTPSDKKNILEHSASELARMDACLKELLHFSRPSTSSLEEVDILALAEVSLSLTRPQKWASGVDFQLENFSEKPLVMAERNSLLQVLLNLLSNAGHSLAESRTSNETKTPRVTLSIGNVDENGYRSLQVIDNGPGVRPQDINRLFEPYFTCKEPGQGTGLGLSISLFIINGFLGKLQYSPNPEGGSCFTITLPVALKDTETVSSNQRVVADET